MLRMSEASVCWLFSMTRSGSSVAAYAAAWPWRVPVADEAMTSFEDRTRPPYNFPEEQKRLRQVYWDAGERLTPEVVGLAQGVFDRMAARGAAEGRGAGLVSSMTGELVAAGDGPGFAYDGPRRVVSKHPHDLIDVAEFRAAFPRHRAVHLLRNPLHRLNSIYRRDWKAIMGENHDLPRFKKIAQRWLDAEHRVVFDQMKSDPAGFFGAVWRAWGWEFDARHVEAASAYQRTHYHASSAKVSLKKKPGKLFSEARFEVPREVVEMYLADGFVRGLMERVGWSVRMEDYLDSGGESGGDGAE